MCRNSRFIWLLILLCFWPALGWADFPQVAASITSSHSTGVTSHSVSIPTPTTAGNLLLCFFATRTNLGITWPAGWNEFFEAATSTSQNSLSIAWREADGAETSPITVTTSVSTRSAHNCYRITGAEDPDTQSPQAATAATGAGANPDPPTATPTGGAKDYLWFAVAGFEVTNTPVCVPSISTYPTNYTNGTQTNSGGGNEAEGRLGVARRELNASSENPGTFTVTSTDCSQMDWVTTTVAVHPAAAAAAIDFFFRRR